MTSTHSVRLVALFRGYVGGGHVDADAADGELAEGARFSQLDSASSSSMIRYRTDDEGVVSQPEYT